MVRLQPRLNLPGSQSLIVTSHLATVSTTTPPQQRSSARGGCRPHRGERPQLGQDHSSSKSSTTTIHLCTHDWSVSNSIIFSNLITSMTVIIALLGSALFFRIRDQVSLVGRGYTALLCVSIVLSPIVDVLISQNISNLLVR